VRRQLSVRGALAADGRWLAPATWVVEGGRTVELRAARAHEHAREAADLVLLPGLVNAHAHLDLAGAEPIAARADFTEWLTGVGRVRGDARDVESQARDEAGALARAGVTAIGDIDASAGAATRGRLQARVDGVSYLEIVGLSQQTARARLAAALELVDRLGGAGVGL
jgi:aminodeoxyfutalosine deaminase